MAERTCFKCGDKKDESLFVKCSTRSDGTSGECKKCHNERQTEYRKNNLEKFREGIKRSNDKLRDETFEHYGGYVCSCCGVTEPQFLTIDHINGGGNKHRKQLSQQLGRVIGGVSFYRELRKTGYPEGYRVLCMNCNWAIRLGGVCPHVFSKEGQNGN